jgi:hypothetical protein
VAKPGNTKKQWSRIRHGFYRPAGCCRKPVFFNPKDESKTIPKALPLHKIDKAMLIKLLIWGLVIFYVYRFFKQKAQLWGGGQQQNFKQHPPKEEEKNGKDEEGEYIDYEELN